jgi:hypothetical protein
MGWLDFIPHHEAICSKRRIFYDGHALCNGTLMLIPAIRRHPNTLSSVKSRHSSRGNLWHGQPHLRNDRSRVGLRPSCLESLLKMRIDSSTLSWLRLGTRKQQEFSSCKGSSRKRETVDIGAEHSTKRPRSSYCGKVIISKCLNAEYQSKAKPQEKPELKLCLMRDKFHILVAFMKKSWN